MQYYLPLYTSSLYYEIPALREIAAAQKWSWYDIVLQLTRFTDYCSVAIDRSYNMARKTVSDKNSSWGVTFVACELTADERDQFKQSLASDDQTVHLIAQCLEARYRIGLSYDKDRTTFIASLTCKDENADNSGLCLTARAADWYTALAVLMYKHFIVLDGVWVQRRSHDDAFG